MNGRKLGGASSRKEGRTPVRRNPHFAASAVPFLFAASAVLSGPWCVERVERRPSELDADFQGGALSKRPRRLETAAPWTSPATPRQSPRLHSVPASDAEGLPMNSFATLARARAGAPAPVRDPLRGSATLGRQ